MKPYCFFRTDFMDCPGCGWYFNFICSPFTRKIKATITGELGNVSVGYIRYTICPKCKKNLRIILNGDNE